MRTNLLLSAAAVLALWLHDADATIVTTEPAFRVNNVGDDSERCVDNFVHDTGSTSDMEPFLRAHRYLGWTPPAEPRAPTSKLPPEKPLRRDS